MPLPPPPLAPGPGAYDLRDYEGPARHYMSSSVFVSSSSRWHDMSSDRTIPGPGKLILRHYEINAGIFGAEYIIIGRLFEQLLLIILKMIMICDLMSKAFFALFDAALLKLVLTVCANKSSPETTELKEIPFFLKV